jgi:hypothetical protein
MKTPYLDGKINELEIYQRRKDISTIGLEMLTEYKAIKSLIENSPIVSTPGKPVWVVDEFGDKRILLVDFGKNAFGRYIVIANNYEESFLNNERFGWYFCNEITPYTPKVNIEVTEEEAVKVEEFLKTLRNGN